jgi:hypothetical protein
MIGRCIPGLETRDDEFRLLCRSVGMADSGEFVSWALLEPGGTFSFGVEADGRRRLKWLGELDEALEGRSPGRSVGTLRVAVVEDLSNDFLFSDESEDFHLGAASVAGQRVDLVDSVDELSPSLVRSTWMGTRPCLLSRLVLLTTGM